jgi:plastocyanin
MLKLTTMACALTLVAAGAAHAAGATVEQEGKKFSTEEVTVKVGETVTFANKDAFTHNVFSKTAGMAFDLRTQRPGESSEVPFEKAGTAEVQCAIHPKMKMTVKVVD